MSVLDRGLANVGYFLQEVHYHRDTTEAAIFKSLCIYFLKFLKVRVSSHLTFERRRGYSFHSPHPGAREK